MLPGNSFRWLLTAVVLCLIFPVASAQQFPEFVQFKSEGVQISFTLRKDFLPAISHMSLDVFTPDIKKVHQQVVTADQSLVWQVKQMSRYTEGNTELYLCAVTLKPVNGEPFILPGRIMQVGKKLEFQLLQERPSNLSGPTPVEFHKALTEAMPNNGSAWFFYALAICDSHRDEFGIPAISIAPPPPPPPALPSSAQVKEIRLTQEEQNRIAEEDKQWKAKKAAFQKDLKIAQPAFLKAQELADDCLIKDTAMAYLAAAAGEFDDEQQRTQWLLKRAESHCAINFAKAESYFALAVNHWQCAYTLTEKYAKPKLKDSDPFHFRAIADPADKQQFDKCLADGLGYLEKALAADPYYPDAMFYKSLMYRERQKTTPNLAERKKVDLEANKIKERGMELMKQREQRR